MFASYTFLQCLICNKRINEQHRKKNREGIYLMEGTDMHKNHPHIFQTKAGMYLLRQTANSV